MNPSTKGGNHQLGHANQNPPDAAITDSKNLPQLALILRDTRNTTRLFAITNNDIIHVIATAKVRQPLFNAILVHDIQETPLWTTEYARVVLNRFPFSRRINNTEHFLEMLLQ